MAMRTEKYKTDNTDMYVEDSQKDQLPNGKNNGPKGGSICSRAGLSSKRVSY